MMMSYDDVIVDDDVGDDKVLGEWCFFGLGGDGDTNCRQFWFIILVMMICMLNKQ